MEIIKKVLITNIEQIVPVDLSGYNESIFCYIQETDFLAPEVLSVLHNAVRLKFNQKCLNRELTLIFVFDEEKKEENTATTNNSFLFNSILNFTNTNHSESLAKKSAKATTKIALRYIAVTLIGVLLLFGDIRWNKSKVTNGVSSYFKNFSIVGLAVKTNNWFEGLFKTDEVIEFYSVSNDHPAYEYEKVKEIEADYYENNGVKISIKKLFWYVGDELFMMRSPARLTDQLKPHYNNKNKAEEFCSTLGARIPSPKELNNTFSGKLSRASSLSGKIDKSLKDPEWTNKEVDGDYYEIYMKDDSAPPINAEIINGKIAGHEDGTFSAFRCVFELEDIE